MLRRAEQRRLKRSSRSRCHHLLKTFYTGSGGWADKQLPDATVTWTSPSGRTYTTKPGGSLFFPILATATGEVAIRKLTTEPGQGRGLMMPRRTRTANKNTRTASPPNGASTSNASNANDGSSKNWKSTGNR